MNAYKSTMQRAAIILLIVVLNSTETSAIEITRKITFITSSSTGDVVSIKGTVNTLAQGLNTVSFDDASAIVKGELTANVTFELGQTPGDADVIGFELLGSSFAQQNLLLSYKVDKTTRTVQFLTNNIGFSVNSVSTNQQLLQTGGGNLPTGSFQIQQSSGMAQIDITNRPSKQQIISPQKSVLSTYLEEIPNPRKFAAEVMPIDYGRNGFVVDINVPISNQQLIYSEVGLPVTLGYSGNLNLVGIFDIPEPSSAALIVGSALIVLLRRERAS